MIISHTLVDGEYLSNFNENKGKSHPLPLSMNLRKLHQKTDIKKNRLTGVFYDRV